MISRSRQIKQDTRQFYAESQDRASRVSSFPRSPEKCANSVYARCFDNFLFMWFDWLICAMNRPFSIFSLLLLNATVDSLAFPHTLHTVRLYALESAVARLMDLSQLSWKHRQQPQPEHQGRLQLLSKKQKLKRNRLGTDDSSSHSVWAALTIKKNKQSVSEKSLKHFVSFCNNLVNPESKPTAASSPAPPGPGPPPWAPQQSVHLERMKANEGEWRQVVECFSIFSSFYG